MLTMIIATLAIVALLVLAYYGVHRPSKDAQRTTDEHDEIEATLAPYLEAIKARTEPPVGGTCRRCKYGFRDITEAPCKDCCGPGATNHFTPIIDEDIQPYIDAIRARMH